MLGVIGGGGVFVKDAVAVQALMVSGTSYSIPSSADI
jgi:hypothetical protein